MRITVLVENTTTSPMYKPKHGLCLYIETANHKILFDLGPDDTYLHNAQKLGIDLTKVDTVVLSHGHKDHGGALSNFLKVNDKAKIYLHRLAFKPHYIKVLIAKFFVGLNIDLTGNDRFILTDDTMGIDDELFLFSDIDGHFDTKSNRVLLKKTSNGYVQDDFAHEQNLIIFTEDKALLFSRCSHRGIANILCAAHEHRSIIRAVFGGFHLHNPATNVSEPIEVVQRLTKELSEQEAVFYTCHCTGNKAFEYMRNSMGDKLQYISTGSIIEI